MPDIKYTKRGNIVNMTYNKDGTTRCIVGPRGNRVYDHCYQHRNKLAIMSHVSRMGW